MSNGLIVALIGLIIVITVHIVVIARWSGQIDGYLKANSARLDDMNAEIKRLRDARHDIDGRLQRHEGILRGMGGRRVTDLSAEGGGA